MSETAANPAPPLDAIVVAIDGSEHGDRALAAGIEIATLEHRPLHIVHSFEPYPTLMALTGDLTDVTGTLRGAARELLDAAVTVAEKTSPGLSVTSALSVSDARSTLVGLSGTARLLVLGSRGLGSFRGLLLGSVSAHVSQHAHCPVLVVRETAAEASGAADTRPVLVGVDGTAASQSAAAFAFAYASARGLPLTAAHLLPRSRYAGYGVWRDLDEERDDLEQHRIDVAGNLDGLQEKYPDVAVKIVLKRGAPAASLVDLSEHCRLLVVGSHRATGWRAVRNGSVGRAVAEHAHCPVAIVPTPVE